MCYEIRYTDKEILNWISEDFCDKAGFLSRMWLENNGTKTIRQIVTEQ